MNRVRLSELEVGSGVGDTVEIGIRGVDSEDGRECIGRMT